MLFSKKLTQLNYPIMDEFVAFLSILDNVDAPLEPLLKLNNVNNKVSITIFVKSFLDLRIFYVARGLKGGLGQKI
jgi:hypothetical protein